MRLKQFAFFLLITLHSNSLLSEENNKSKNFGEIIIHVVKKGDTLSSISKKYSIKKDSIIKVF